MENRAKESILTQRSLKTPSRLKGGIISAETTLDVCMSSIL